jgi:uncharacterized protein YqjF (DUF2071 family)
VKKPSDKDVIARRYPTAAARQKADEAIDELSETEPMTAFLDAWLAAYVAAGGKVEK